MWWTPATTANFTRLADSTGECKTKTHVIPRYCKYKQSQDEVRRPLPVEDGDAIYKSDFSGDVPVTTRLEQASPTRGRAEGDCCNQIRTRTAQTCACVEMNLRHRGHVQ